MASAKALDMYSSSCRGGGYWVALDVERNLPGVGILLALPGVGMPDWRPLPGVGVDIEAHKQWQCKQQEVVLALGGRDASSDRNENVGNEHGPQGRCR